MNRMPFYQPVGFVVKRQVQKLIYLRVFLNRMLGEIFVPSEAHRELDKVLGHALVHDPPEQTALLNDVRRSDGLLHIRTKALQPLIHQRGLFEKVSKIEGISKSLQARYDREWMTNDDDYLKPEP